MKQIQGICYLIGLSLWGRLRPHPVGEAGSILSGFPERRERGFWGFASEWQPSQNGRLTRYAVCDAVTATGRAPSNEGERAALCRKDKSLTEKDRFCGLFLPNFEGNVP